MVAALWTKKEEQNQKHDFFFRVHVAHRYGGIFARQNTAHSDRHFYYKEHVKKLLRPLFLMEILFQVVCSSGYCRRLFGPVGKSKLYSLKTAISNHAGAKHRDFSFVIQFLDNEDDTWIGTSTYFS